MKRDLKQEQEARKQIIRLQQLKNLSQTPEWQGYQTLILQLEQDAIEEMIESKTDKTFYKYQGEVKAYRNIRGLLGKALEELPEDEGGE